jgi:hypothetical protein
MIKISQPALAMHSVDVPDYRYKMDYTWYLRAGAGAADAAYCIKCFVDRSLKPTLKSVVVNCHGAPGELCVGGLNSPSITIGQLGVFAPLRGWSIGTIYLVACNVAKGPTGIAFCSKLASTTGCFVVGADASQQVETRFFLPANAFGAIDDFEGTAYLFYPSGKAPTVFLGGVTPTWLEWAVESNPLLW